jgi:hypothetical protein
MTTTNALLLADEAVNLLISKLEKTDNLKIVNKDDIVVSLSKYRHFLFVQLHYDGRVRHGKWLIQNNLLKKFHASRREYKDIMRHLKLDVGLSPVEISCLLNTSIEKVHWNISKLE